MDRHELRRKQAARGSRASPDLTMRTNQKPPAEAGAVPQRPRSRRERRSEAARKPVVHVVMPGMEVARAEIKPRETISAFLRRTGWATKDRKYGWQFKKGLPTVLEVNGENVLRKDWRYQRIASDDVVRFVSFPMGGSGSSGTKQVAGLVALIAVSAFASLVVGPAIAAEFGATAGWLGTAAVGIGGALVINVLERKPGVGNQCDRAEQRSARPDGRRSLPVGRDSFVDRAEGSPDAAPVLRGGDARGLSGLGADNGRGQCFCNVVRFAARTDASAPAGLR